jgi:hypothetical protein
MSSILKVDQLQDSGGNAIITSNGSGTFTSSLPNTGITMADQWRLTADFTGNAEPITSNLERNDTQFSVIGTGMTESSGIFSFPSTGIYLVRFYHFFKFKDGNGLSRAFQIKYTSDNSSYSALATGNRNGLDEGKDIRSVEAIIDVTDISNVKVQFTVEETSTNDVTFGNSTKNETFMTFIRLGDT